MNGRGYWVEIVGLRDEVEKHGNWQIGQDWLDEWSDLAVALYSGGSGGVQDDEDVVGGVAIRCRTYVDWCMMALLIHLSWLHYSRIGNSFEPVERVHSRRAPQRMIRTKMLMLVYCVDVMESPRMWRSLQDERVRLTHKSTRPKLSVAVRRVDNFVTEMSMMMLMMLSMVMHCYCYCMNSKPVDWHFESFHWLAMTVGDDSIDMDA